MVKALFFLIVLFNKILFSFSTTCYLTNAEPVNPFPSLKKCYKFNENSCCTINHDNVVSEITQELIGESCSRNYKEFEDLLCIACAPESGRYIKDGKFYLCESFAKAIWQADLNSPSTAFDNCGLNVVERYEEWQSDVDLHGGLIFSSTFDNFKDFVEHMPIPFLVNDAGDGLKYSLEIIADGDDCYSKGKYFKLSIFVLGILGLLII